LDGKDVVRAAAGQVAGVLALGVPRAGGDDRAADGDAVQQHGQHRDLAGRRPGPGLAQHHAVGVVQGGQQVPAILAASGRAASRRAVHRDHPPRPRRREGAPGRPGARRRIQRIGVQGPAGPAGRWMLTAPPR
jgi:hypothetical protein